MAAAVKKAVAEIDPDQSVTEVMSMERLLERSTGIYQFYMRILGNSETDGTFLILFEKTRFVRNERRFSESGETSRLSPVSVPGFPGFPPRGRLARSVTCSYRCAPQCGQWLGRRSSAASAPSNCSL